MSKREYAEKAAKDACAQRGIDPTLAPLLEEALLAAFEDPNDPMEPEGTPDFISSFFENGGLD